MISRNKKRKSAAKISHSRSFRIDIWLLRHLQVALASLGRLTRSPLSTLMTSAVIGIALALPSGLFLMLDNVKQVAGSWDSAATISLFLTSESNEQQAQQLADKLYADAAINRVQIISRYEALAEFKRLSGFASALDSLKENPLPQVIIVEPGNTFTAPELAEELLARLQQEPLVDTAQLDLQWVKRFHAITEIAQRGVIVLATLLGLCVLLIVGNTIRLEIQNRHAEIEITKLIGATNAFIRRPFLYNGFWYGLFGGIIAWLMISASFYLLDTPIQQLSNLYQSGFDLSGAGPLFLLLLLLGSGLLGLAGSWVAVGRHLSAIEPT